MGVHTTVTDHIPGSPAKGIADESWDLNGLDIESLERRARAECVDGIMVGVADRLVVSAAELCEKLSLPTPAPSAACRTLSRKDEFNRMCERFGISTIPRVAESTLPSGGKLPFRCFVKPVDSNSGRGMAICSTREELEVAKQNAVLSSASRRILIERCMECDDTAVHLTIQDGHVSVSAVVDRFTTRENPFGSRVCVGAVYPSRYLKLYQETVHSRITAMLHDLGVRNGVLTMQAFVEDQKFHIYDPGFRLQGEGCDHHFLHATGYDQREALVNFALSGRMQMANNTSAVEWPSQATFAATIWVLVSDGAIGEICGLAEAQAHPNVFFIAQRLFTNDIVTHDAIGTERQVLARIYVSAPAMDKLLHAISEVEDVLAVRSMSKANMMLPLSFSTHIKRRLSDAERS
jgi:biotin carboxylase